MMDGDICLMLKKDGSNTMPLSTHACLNQNYLTAYKSPP